MIIQLDDLQVTFSRKKVKNINLRIHANGQIMISAPQRYPLASVERYLQEKKDWIKAQRQRLQAKPKALAYEYVNGEMHDFLGSSYRLMIHEDTHLKTMQLEAQTLHCYRPYNAVLSVSDLMQHWYRKEMQALLPALMQKWQKIIGVQAESYHIKRMKRLWGSCNPTDKRIWLNLNLIKKPIICIEYVIAHELIHLLEPSHNQRFYRLMDNYMPQWKVYKKLLDG